MSADPFADLDAIIAEAEARKRDRSDIAAKRTRLSRDKLSVEERERLQAEVAMHDLLFTWQVTANVALFHSQQCAACGAIHTMFQGWFTQQDHRTDSHARRLVAGKAPDATLPERIERHHCGLVEMCADCAEACVIIDETMRSAGALAAVHEEALALDAQRMRREELAK